MFAGELFEHSFQKGPLQPSLRDILLYRLLRQKKKKKKKKKANKQTNTK